MTNTDEQKVRESTTCPGCGGAKDRGCVVCWSCFKYRADVVPFKYWENDTPEAGDLEAWLLAIGRPSLEAQAIL